LHYPNLTTVEQWRTSRLKSFSHAFKGVIFNLKHEPNFFIQLIFAVLVISAGIVFPISKSEWLVLIIAIGGVLSAEAMNTAIEKVCDRFVEGHDALVKIIKDSAAAAVLIMALTAAVAGIIVFLPYLLESVGISR